MRFIYTCTLFLLCFSLSAQVITTSTLSPPAELRCGDVPAKLNNVVFGAVPPNSQDKPVVVYIHGWFDNGYAWFMAKNKWYEESYNAGYRSAFFFQSYSDAFQDNGRVVAAMIRETCKHFNTGKVIAVCHSKGGFDIEWALYNENVWDSVQGVITLSTPYWGAPMADLIATPVIRSVLENVPVVAPIFRGKGTYQMQTAYMAGVVRPMMDNHPQNRPEKFHCFATWGYDHVTILPDAVPDDILKVVFYNYRPLCADIPGFGKLAGDLMSGFMNITGSLSKLVQVQDRYNNPSKNLTYLDGLAPYYSSIRPGAVEISEPPPSQQSYLNHIEVLLSSYTWNIVQPEIEYFKNNPVLRISNTPRLSATSDDVSKVSPSSDLQLIQSDEIEIKDAAACKLYLAGEYVNAAIQVLNTDNQVVKTIPLNLTTNAVTDIFHEINLSFLAPNTRYVLKSSVPLTGFMQDGLSAAIRLDLHADKTYYVNAPLGFEVSLNDWPDNMEFTAVKGYLNRNMDASGDVIHDKMIPVGFGYDAATGLFICKDKPVLPEGVYNVSVCAEGNSVKRFATASIVVKQEKPAFSQGMAGLSIFPDPARDFFSVQFDVTTAAAYSIEIVDVLGCKIMERNLGALSPGRQEFQFSALENRLPEGVHILTVKRGGETIAARQIIIN